MIEDPVLRNEWFVAASSDDVPEGKLKAVKILGEDVVLWRSGGKVIAWKDLCIHRGTKLSLAVFPFSAGIDPRKGSRPQDDAPAFYRGSTATRSG